MLDLDLSFRQEQVHIWKIPLPLSDEIVTRLKEILNLEERERGRKFRFPQDQQRFISARGALRTILGSYLNERPEALTFEYGNRGKPCLVHPPGAPRIDFNLTHCSEMAVICVTPGRRIGIDAETVRTFLELEDIVARHFSSEERASIESAYGEARTRLFFHVWTRHEAVAKACGLDLSAALSDLEIPPYPPGAAARLPMDGKCTWSLHDLQLGATCVGALCVEGVACDPAFKEFDSLLEPRTLPAETQSL